MLPIHVVAPSNINRQAIAFESTVGARKVDIMAAMVRDINPACRVIARDAFVLAENLEELIDTCLAATGGRLDNVIDAIDTISTKLAIAALAQQRGLPLISSMGGAKKLHPECLRFADVHKTVNCPLARIMRKECRRRGIRHLRVLYSCEEPVRISAAPGTARSERTDLGTASWMPPPLWGRCSREKSCGSSRASARTTTPTRRSPCTTPHKRASWPDARAARREGRCARGGRALRPRCAGTQILPARMRPRRGLSPRRHALPPEPHGERPRSRSRRTATRYRPARRHARTVRVPGSVRALRRGTQRACRFRAPSLAHRGGPCRREDGCVGEVGLDFSRAHASTRAAQLCAFDRIVAACAAQPRAGRVVSIHAVHAATEALDILERHGLPAHATCIFHWFSGSGEDLNRLRALGCLVSVNECMLATRRGRAYARQLPEDALLLETDAPAWLDAPCSAAELEASLAHTLSLLAEIRGASRNSINRPAAVRTVRPH